MCQGSCDQVCAQTRHYLLHANPQRSSACRLLATILQTRFWWTGRLCPPIYLPVQSFYRFWVYTNLTRCALERAAFAQVPGDGYCLVFSDLHIPQGRALPFTEFLLAAAASQIPDLGQGGRKIIPGAAVPKTTLRFHRCQAVWCSFLGSAPKL